MYEYLKFPSCNKVGKKLSSKRYTKSANLTGAERKKLAAYLDSIEILYSFQFEDGEIIVLLAEYSAIENGKFTLNNFVKAVAQSLPYEILLIIRCEGVIRFFAFDERVNSVNKRRMKVLSIYSSTDIIPIENNFSDNMLITDLRDAAIKASSANELYNEWCSKLSCDDRPFIFDTFKYSIAKYREIHKVKIIFEKLMDKDRLCELDDDISYNLYEGEPLEIEDEIDHRLFVDFCAYYSRKLYECVTETLTLTEEEWLKIYLDGCSSFAMEVFKRVLDCKCAVRISSAFWYNGEDYIDASDCYDPEDLKEYIGYFYFDDREE